MEAKRKQYQPQGRRGNLLENLYIVILAFYPLRHISWGLDLWDTGYNYANFQYIGTEHMDPMWLFSTYLANVTGSLLMKLPNADSLMGMNLYTGLFVSVLALMGYFFCTRKLKLPKGIAFIGEMTAVSLCWCPTAILYNYLTYVLFLAAVIVLYLGLTKEKRGYLICAGVLLGSNILVRFSNLPEMGMIVAVWAYDFIVWLEERKNRGRERSVGSWDRGDDKQVGFRLGAGKAEGFRPGARKQEGFRSKSGKSYGFWRRTVQHTLMCLLGYLAGLAFWLSYIHIRYGIGEYIAGIGRLFAMTENAQDYKATSMLKGILLHYVQNLYWAARIGVIIVGGLVLFAIAGWLEGRLSGYAATHQAGGRSGASRDTASDWKRLPKAAKAIHVGIRLLWIGVSVAMIGWLYYRKFCSFLFYSYDPIWHPGPMFLMLAMLIALIRIFHRNSSREEKLISGMVILIILITPIGSNNGVLPSLNNLFLAAPYTLWESWRFVCYVGSGRGNSGISKDAAQRLRNLADQNAKGAYSDRNHKLPPNSFVFSFFAAKCILTAFLALCLFQFGCFGLKFAFAEGTGIQETTAFVENNPVLKNIGMSPEKALWIQGLGDYVNQERLQGKEVILYGKIPSLSYYLQMPSAFNPWSDLDSYQFWVMEAELEELTGLILMKGAEKPVVILEDRYARYVDWASGAQSALILSKEERVALEGDSKWRPLLDFIKSLGYEESFCNKKRLALEGDSKWVLLCDFMESLGYEQGFRNEKFAVYR